MKRQVTSLILAALFLGGTVFAGKIAINKVSAFAQQENQEKTVLVQDRILETISLLEDLSEDPYICSQEAGYKEKAAFLTDKNQREELGYMMLRILDKDINIYREDIGLASNLASRDYMQRLYTTGEVQVTDAFLAGADGITINYTVATAIEENGQVTGALMAAIYGNEINGYLQDDQATNVLIGSLLQYMSGIPEDRFGLAVAQVLEGERRTTRPVENILLDFSERKNGAFWSLGNNLQYVVYSPVARTDWVVMTEIQVFPLIQHILIVYGCSVAVLLAAGILLLHRKKPSQVKDEAS